MMDKRLLALVPEALRHVLATVAWPLLAAGIVLLAVRVHCCAPAQRQAIKDVMRYAGPKMLLSHPVMTVRHGIDTLRARQSHQ